MSINILLFLILSFFTNSDRKENHKVFVNESTYLHIDKSFYVTGEIIWYKLYLGQSFKGQPVAIGVALSDATGKIIGSHFLHTKGNTYVSGYYKIPYELDSGQYLLTFSGTQSDLSQNLLARATIPIYNDLQGLPVLTKQSLNGREVFDRNELNNELNITIDLSDDTYQPRSLVDAEITITDLSGTPVMGSVSIGVIDKQLTDEKSVQRTQVEYPDAFKNNIYLNGKVYDNDNQLVNAGLVGAFMSEQGKIYYAKIKDNGDFKLQLPKFFDEKTVQFLGDPDGVENIRVLLEKSIPYKIDAPLAMDDKIAEYLQLSQQRKKIFQHYAKLEYELEAEKSVLKLDKIKPNKSWKIEEYEHFEFMYIFFKENLSPLRFKFNKDSTYTAGIMHDASKQYVDKFFSSKPLFIIDNVATRDADFVARMRMQDIEQVDLFSNPKNLNRHFKLFGRGGVVKITTNNPLNKLPVMETKNSLDISGFQRNAQFPTTETADRQSPLFRPQIYWNANIDTNKNGTASIRWNQTDDKSTFLIQVVAQDEMGRMGYATKEFVVK